jgi:putative ABC transport system permease protein
VIVSENVAQALWNGNNPLGDAVHIEGDRDRVVVGVVGNVKGVGLSREFPLQIYLPYGGPDRQQGASRFNVIAKCRGDCARWEGQVIDAIKTSGGDAGAIERIATMADLIGAAMGAARLRALALGAYSALAMTLAFVGCYSLASYVAEQRAHEIGVRVSLGARRMDVVLLSVREGVIAAGAGIVVGCISSFWVVRLLRGLLFGVEPLDVSSFAIATLTLAGGAVIALLVPAVRLARRNVRDLLQLG